MHAKFLRPKLVLAALLALPLLALSPGAPRVAEAHCEVPCGIYADQMRFEQMLEDTATIRKAIASIHDLAAATSPVDKQQFVRWVNTKEEHATHTQHIIAQYFMTQRIKADDEHYVARLTAAHRVMQAAMWCKQRAGDKDADVLEEAIKKFHAVYEGKAAPADHGHDHDHDHDK